MVYSSRFTRLRLFSFVCLVVRSMGCEGFVFCTWVLNSRYQWLLDLEEEKRPRSSNTSIRLACAACAFARLSGASCSERAPDLFCFLLRVCRAYSCKRLVSIWPGYFSTRAVPVGVPLFDDSASAPRYFRVYAQNEISCFADRGVRFFNRICVPLRAKLFKRMFIFGKGEDARGARIKSMQEAHL